MSEHRAAPHVFSVPAGVPFLPTLADALLAGRLVDLPDLARDPLALADVTVLLPTRRAVRALGDHLTAHGVTVLPRIRPIGDVDEEEELLRPSAEAGADLLALPPAVSPLKRLVALARLVLAWDRAVMASVLDLAPGDALRLPASAADALGLAGDLARLMDEVTRAGVPWDSLDGLAPDDLPQFWRITLDFLKIATSAWPAHLAERGLADPAARRDRLIRAEAARLAARPPPAPIIAAGSTGSVLATAELLSAIARLPNGAVLLPGLDRGLDEAGWRAIGRPGEDPVPGHPQYGLKLLLESFGLGREEVAELVPPPAAAVARARLVSEALRPAETTEAWRAAALPPEAFDDVGLIVARNEQEEALAVALALREAVEEGRTAALVTPDRTVARRVAVELRRWGLAIDDSAGAPLAGTPPAVFARLLAEAALSHGEPVRLLALAKHPLAAFGMDRAACRRAARTLELALFRGGRLGGGAASLPQALAEAEEPSPTRPRRRRPAEFDRRGAAMLAAALAEALAPLEALAPEAPVAAAELTRLLADALAKAARDEAGSDDALWQGNAGEALADLLAGLIEAGGGLALASAEFPAFLATAMRGIAVAQPPAADSRIHIWGTLEARLQSVEVMILGGLDEGVWPSEARTDPWLSRTMRTAVGLEPPERRIGLAAHDFAEAMAAPRVLVTRAEKRGGAPTIASRWLQRLLAVAGEAGGARIAAAGARYLAWARKLDRVAAAPAPARRPAPRPPVEARPRRLSITEIETWVRDPYAIYAKHVLGLRPLDPIGALPDAALRGTLLHDMLAEFTRDWRGRYDAGAREALAAIGRQKLAPLAAYPEVYALWLLRAEAVADWLVSWEASRAVGIASRHAEIDGALDIVGAPGGPFRLTGRADRIDLRTDGGVEVYDYKSGSPPSAPQVLTGFAPQLGLEAAMVRAGAFGEAFAGRSVAHLAWIALGRAGRGEALRSAVGKDHTADAIGALALGQLERMIATYDDPARGYPPLERPMFIKRWQGDYDHLARIREWSLAAEDDEDE